MIVLALKFHKFRLEILAYLEAHTAHVLKKSVWMNCYRRPI
jgi:hypothetical protein